MGLQSVLVSGAVQSNFFSHRRHLKVIFDDFVGDIPWGICDASQNLRLESLYDFNFESAAVPHSCIL